ncbi:BtrH N-terminal domain-containing protein [Paenibacillus massiliensis]|uniref:BtrH N-terminal domain-containing protein n=1 Tax=Paenibacillus massiliensis TaxID=225917 RepID=UPI00036070ED|nr:BtrH N-terminal domain-containing protein [Paenibacillus massiliensis]
MHPTEELYLACHQTLLMYYFKSRIKIKQPIDAVYCTALESISRIYDGSIVKRQSRFHYTNEMLLGELPRLGIHVKLLQGTSYTHLRQPILELLEQGKEVFLFVDEYYLPYSLQFQKEHLHHSHMLTGYEYHADESLIFHVIDNVGAHIKEQTCPESILQCAFEALQQDSISYFEWEESEGVSWERAYFMDRLQQALISYEDNYELFYGLTEMTEASWAEMLHSEQDLACYGHAFGLLAGSRFCFLLALRALGCDGQREIDLLMKASDEARVIMFLFNKALFSRKLNRERIQGACHQILKFNEELLNGLRETCGAGRML